MFDEHNSFKKHVIYGKIRVFFYQININRGTNKKKINTIFVNAKNPRSWFTIVLIVDAHLYTDEINGTRKVDLTFSESC